MNRFACILSSALFTGWTALSATGQIVLNVAQPLVIDFNNLNTDFGGSHEATGGSSLFPASTDPGSSLVFTGLTTSTDYNPGGVYSNTDAYLTAVSLRALRDGATSDYALGMKDSGDRSIILEIENNTGGTLDAWSIAYGIEQYSQGGSATLFSFSYSLNGSSFVTTNLTGAEDVVAQTTPGGSSDGNLANVLVTPRVGVVTESVAHGETIWFRWRYDHQSGTSVHLGVDDIVVTPVPEPTTLMLGGLLLPLGLVWCLRCRAQRRVAWR